MALITVEIGLYKIILPIVVVVFLVFFYLPLMIAYLKIPSILQVKFLKIWNTI